MTNQTAGPVVLLVDDQRFVGAALGRLLAGEDIQLHCCSVGLDAVAQANTIKPDVILQDLVMPGIDGLALLGLYRANSTTATTPVIVLSGNDDGSARTAALAAGAVDYLVKLPTKEVLLDCIRRHVIGSDTRAQSPGATSAAVTQDTVEETLDPAVMAAFRQGPGSADFLRMLIDQFVEEADAQVETLREAARRQDAAAVKATAHGLKGSSRIMGAMRLAAMCARVEEGLATPIPGVVAPALMASLSAELVRARRALAAERKTLTQPAVATVADAASKQHSLTTHS